MMCDASHAGSVMECPTCFQKIVAPQAPAPDAKFILTGTVYTEKKIPETLAGAADLFQSPARKALPIWVFLLIILAAGGIAAIFFNGKLAQWAARTSWQGTDVGPVGAPGSFSRTHGVITLTGSGADTWRRADSFQYVYQPLNGDGALTARVLHLKNTHEWAKAGVMIRATTNANSAFVLTAIRPDGQAQFIWRKAAGKEAASSPLEGGPGFPKWVKIVRNGNTFAAYWKSGETDAWQQIGPVQTVKLPPQAIVGLVVCAHDAGILCDARFDQVAVQRGVVPLSGQ